MLRNSCREFSVAAHNTQNIFLKPVVALSSHRRYSAEYYSMPNGKTLGTADERATKQRVPAGQWYAGSAPWSL